jgi:hypothetical protein
MVIELMLMTRREQVVFGFAGKGKAILKYSM